MLVVRERVRSVRPEDEPSFAGFRLALACACAAGAVAIVWLLGHLGFRLGAAPLLGVPELLAEPGEGLATGAATLLRMPSAIHRLALQEPLLILLGMAALALPAAGLAAAKPVQRGGPRPRGGVVALATLGVLLAVMFAATQVVWTTSAWRIAMLSPLPSTAAEVRTWADGLDLVAGLDALALTTMVLFCVLVPRLPSPNWLRLLGMVLVLLATAIGLVGAAVSGAGAAHVHAQRSVIRAEATPEALLLGYTRRHTVLLQQVDDTVMVILADPPGRLVVIDRRSIVEALNPGS